MNETIKELITADIYQTLGSLGQFTGVNDAIAERQQLRGNVPKDRLLLIQDDGDTPEDSPLQKDDFTASYTIRCFVAVSDSASATPDPDVTAGRLVADVRKALMVDYSRAGWAINTIPGADSPLPGDERAGYVGRALSISVLYRTAKDDPFSQ